MKKSRLTRLWFALALLAASPSLAGPPEPAPTRIFDSRGGLGHGWQDIGWAPHRLVKGAPASLDLAGRAGWIISHPQLSGSFGWLVFRVRAPASFGNFLEVGVDSTNPERFPRVRLTPELGKPSDGGFTSYRIATRDLDPKGLQFDRVVFRAADEVGHEPVLLDDIALVEQDAAAAAASAPARPLRISIDCAAPGKAISPLIYGIGPAEGAWWDIGATARRWGGNPSSRYNWDNGHAWNTGNDWFFRNVNYSGQDGAAYENWLEEGLSRGVRSALTVPMIGWVAKDTRSYSFPVATFGPQRATAPEDKDVGNGVARDGTLIAPGPPTNTSIAAPPEFIRRWVAEIRAKDVKRGARSVQEYILDNEPTLWNVTHRDVHPNPVSYDELLNRTIKYASAVREADPQATIAGFTGWGWTGYYYSALDMAPGGVPHVDRLSHGNEPLLPWWLRKVREYETRSGKHLIDVLDVHYYPQAANLGIAQSGGTDPDTAALRIRSTRALWDPTYSDESWIGEPVRLIPRLHEWVDANAPGLGISIGEYNFGAEQHMSGGLALAEALGRFGEGGLTSAFYWTAPPANSPAYWAFRAYRNFDGKGGHFLDTTAPVSIDGKLASAFASRDPATGHVVAVLLNFDPTTAGETTIDLSSCGLNTRREAYSYSGANGGFADVPLAAPDVSGVLHQRLAPYSMTVLDLTQEKHP